MTLLFKSDSDRASWWREEFGKLLPDLEVRIWPDEGSLDEIEFALVWQPEPGQLARYPNLKAIFSIGAGVDHLFKDPELPTGVPITRIVDPSLTSQMQTFAVHQVLIHHRHHLEYQAQQHAGDWAQLPLATCTNEQVGIMGMGVLGQAAARAFLALGFKVAGWSHSPKEIDAVQMFAGPAQLEAFLRKTDHLVCLLPLTSATEAILSARLFDNLPRGASVTNLGRGGHLVEDDLIAALDRGHLRGASLDVFQSEPLPADHPFWSHEKIVLTPHIAGLTDPTSALEQIVDNIKRSRRGEPLLHVVDPEKGY